MFLSQNYNNKSIGLLKRGLGGITIEDSASSPLSASSYYLNSKMPKTLTTLDLMSTSTIPGAATTSTNLAILDAIEQRIGTKSLKPKLWNRFLIHNTHMSNSTNVISNLNLHHQRRQQIYKQIEEEQTNMGQLEQQQQEKQTLTKNLEWCLADAGLFNSRRFRVNWSMHKSSFTYLQLNSNSSNNNSQFKNLIQFKMPTSTSWWSLQSEETLTPSKFNTLRENCQVYLQAQLDLTEFQLASNGSSNRLPLLKTKRGNEAIRQMCECAQQIRNTIGDNPDADNVSHDKMVWTLCQSLWGDIPDAFKANPNMHDLINGKKSDVSSQYELEQMRKRLLSEWLSDVSSHRVERECRLIKFNGKTGGNTYLQAIFSMLTVNRVMDACLTAVDNGDFRLALLLSQSTHGGGGGGGGNETVRRMIKKQLNEWSTSQSDRYINPDMMKFYVLISGDLTRSLSSSSSSISSSVSHLVNVCENLDWKRQFALVLWYNCLPVHSINDALVFYEQAIKANVCSRPLPPYIEDNAQSSSTATTTTTTTTTKPPNLLIKLNNQPNTTTNLSNVHDTCYHLIKLYCDPSRASMEDLLSPLAHTSNQLDTRLSWHLAQSIDSALSSSSSTTISTTISRLCLDTLCDSYACQLASLDMWHWAVFVLMHMQGDERRRESCVRLYLAKNVTSESELSERELFCIEKLRVPESWVYECKAMRAKCANEPENQFELLLKAKKWNEAHAVLIEFLAPDMLLRQNLNKLQEYLSVLSKESHIISKWNLGGQIYLDYIRLEQQAQYLFNFDTKQISSKNNLPQRIVILGDESDSFDNQMEKYLSDENLKELNHQLISLSSRLKEFESKTPKKLLCSLRMSKLLLKYFNVFNEMNNANTNASNSSANIQSKLLNANDESDESQDENNVDTSKNATKCLTRQIVERASHLTECIPEQDLMGTMLLKKSKYTHDFLLLSRKR